MKTVTELTREELERIAEIAFLVLFTEEPDEDWNADGGYASDDDPLVVTDQKDWDGGDVCESMAHVLEEVGMAPSGADEGDPWVPERLVKD